LAVVSVSCRSSVVEPSVRSTSSTVTVLSGDTLTRVPAASWRSYSNVAPVTACPAGTVKDGEVHVPVPTTVPSRFSVAAMRMEIEPGGLPTAGSYGVEVVHARPTEHGAVPEPVQPSASAVKPLPPLG
jgi:hypothetical protein